MMTFDSHLTEKLKGKRFKRMYEEEKEFLEISIKILEVWRNQCWKTFAFSMFIQ